MSGLEWFVAGVTVGYIFGLLMGLLMTIRSVRDAQRRQAQR